MRRPAPLHARALATNLVLALGFVCLASPSSAHADDLAARIDALVAKANLGDKVGIQVVSAMGGDPLYSHNADLPLNPASNMKLLSAAAALRTLGPETTFRTGVYGQMDGSGDVPVASLQGFGDPSLALSDLLSLASDLAARGVKHVGTVVVDGSAFDDHVLPPAFEQQPGEAAPFRAAIGAVAIDRGSFLLDVRPGAAVGDKGVVRVEAPGYFEIENALTTTASGAPNIIADQKAKGGKLVLRVSGSMALGAPSLSFRRRVEDPLAFAGHAFVACLKRVGIRVDGTVQVSATPPGLVLLASHRSAPLSDILKFMGKDSDNFVAEMVLKDLAVAAGQRASSAKALDAVRAMLTAAGVQVSGPGAPTLVNGSGLFNGNLVSASHFTHVLSFMYRNRDWSSEYISHLAIAGHDGTLEGRMTDVPRGSIRAKTGTLRDAIALSGYVIGPTPDRTLVFSFVANNVDGKVGNARTLADAICRELVASLN